MHSVRLRSDDTCLVRLSGGDSGGIEDAVKDNTADAIREHWASVKLARAPRKRLLTNDPLLMNHAPTSVPYERPQ